MKSCRAITCPRRCRLAYARLAAGAHARWTPPPRALQQVDSPPGMPGRIRRTLAVRPNAVPLLVYAHMMPFAYFMKLSIELLCWCWC